MIAFVFETEIRAIHKIQPKKKKKLFNMCSCLDVFIVVVVVIIVKNLVIFLCLLVRPSVVPTTLIRYRPKIGPRCDITKVHRCSSTLCWCHF